MGKLKEMKGKIKEMKKTVTEHEIPEQKIFTVPMKPKDKKDFMKSFVKKMSDRKIQIRDQEFMTNLLEEPDDLIAKFQLLGLIKATLYFNVRFDIESSSTEVYFSIKLNVDEPLMTVHMVNSINLYQQHILPIISKIVNKAVVKKQKEPKEKKDKKPKEDKSEKEHKEKKPKDPLKLLKLQFVEGKISEEEYMRKKKILEK